MTRVALLAALTAGLGLSATPSYSQGEDACFSKLTRFNICEQAKKIQAQIAPTLPMQISSEVTLASVTAAGPILQISGRWNLSKADLDASLSRSGMSLSQLSAGMDKHTSNFVCSNNVLAAFVRLGGRVSYAYNTADSFHIATPTVAACPGS